MTTTSDGWTMLRLFLGSFCFTLGLVLLRMCSLARRSDASPEYGVWITCIGAAFCLAGLLILIMPAFRRKR